MKKVVVGDSTAPSAFSFTVSNGGGTHAFEADGTNTLSLPAGTYTVTEPAVSGWTTTYCGCSRIVLASSQTTVPTCTITNTKQQSAPPPPPPENPKLNVKKVVVGDSTAPSAFSFTVSNGGGTRAFEADGTNTLTLPAGTYTVTETAVSGWTTTYSGCSGIVLASSQTTVPTCTITNTKQQSAPPPPPPENPKLNVKKVVVGDSTAPSAFSFTVSNGGGTRAFEADGTNTLSLPAGTYTVTETAVSGWTTTYSGCSGIVLASSQTTVPTCTVTNTKQQSALQPPPPRDTTAPTTPGRPQATDASKSHVTLEWGQSSDQVGVEGYGLYLDDELVATVPHPAARLEELACGTMFSVSVDAYDAAGNRSARAGATARTDECPRPTETPQHSSSTWQGAPRDRSAGPARPDDRGTDDDRAPEQPE